MGNEILHGIVTAVADGDTFDLSSPNGIEIVRLSDVDAPERGQPGYTASTNRLRGLLTSRGVSRYVVCNKVARDVYGRAVCDVLVHWLDRTGRRQTEHVNELMRSFIRWNKAAWRSASALAPPRTPTYVPSLADTIVRQLFTPSSYRPLPLGLASRPAARPFQYEGLATRGTTFELR